MAAVKVGRVRPGELVTITFTARFKDLGAEDGGIYFEPADGGFVRYLHPSFKPRMRRVRRQPRQG